MKLIILDNFRRKWWFFAIILVAYFVFQSVVIHENAPQGYREEINASVNRTVFNTTHNFIFFQLIMWLGFLLLTDIQRGLPRVLISMPMTARQIGRALWLAAVALPAIALTIAGFLAFLFFYQGKNAASLMEDYSMNCVFATIYLGAVFGAQTLMPTIVPETFVEKTRALLIGLLFMFALIGGFLLQMENLLLSQIIFATYTILSVLGWFRAERMVLQRAGFRVAAQSAGKKSQPHKIPQGFGGLPYLVQKTFIQTTLIGLAIVVWMAVVTSFFHFSNDKNHTQMIASIIDGGSTPYIFVLLFATIPMVFQLRFLRTLPISPSTLAATMVLLPVTSIAAIGLIVTALASAVAGETVIPHTVNNFLMLGAKAAVMVSVIVWRGLDVVTYILIMMMVIADSFITLGMTMFFHLGSKTAEAPVWIYLVIFFAFVAISFALTKMLLTTSSNAYRVRTMLANAWSMARR